MWNPFWFARTAPQAEDDGEGGAARQPVRDNSSSVMRTIVISAGIGLGVALTYSASTNENWRTLPATAMIAAAAMSSGGLLGLLFGVPRSLGTAAGTGGAATGQPASDVAQPGIGANTNLEQISDWLTKIIVGVTLTQLGTIRSGAARLFNALAPALGSGDQAAAFAGGVVVYFSVSGFLVGWLFARLRLGVAMSNADALLALSRRAVRAGDTETARAAQEAAKASIAASTGTATVEVASDEVDRMANQYEQIRATLPPSPRRTSQMADIVRSAQQLARTRSLSAQDVSGWFNTGSEGRRIVALGLMQGDPRLADFPGILDAITRPRSAFEQYHALTIANLIAPTLGSDERSRLLAAVQNPEVTQRWTGDTGRSEVAARIASRISNAAG